MPDSLEHIGTAMLQHGPDSDRVYLMDPGNEPAGTLIKHIAELCDAHGYGKVFAKMPAARAERFLEAGYEIEARVPAFFKGREDAFFLALYPKQERKHCPELDSLKRIVDISKEKAGDITPPLPDNISLRQASEDDIEAMAELYKVVFETYPFPVHDPDYLLKTMREHVLYFVAARGQELIGISSAEMNRTQGYAEMTDFAVNPDKRGGGIAVHLLLEMEKHMPAMGITTLYTIARACSHGMNITFARCGYAYGGMLLNNTQISGAIESMNVWYKHPKAT